MELWKDWEAERWVKSSCHDPSRTQRIVPVIFFNDYVKSYPSQ